MDYLTEDQTQHEKRKLVRIYLILYANISLKKISLNVQSKIIKLLEGSIGKICLTLGKAKIS